jgi:hypothetical protein
MVEREAEVSAQAGLRDREPQHLGEPHQSGNGRGIAARARRQHERVLSLDQPPRHAELVHGGKLRAVDLVQRHFAGKGEIHRPAGLGAGHLQGARDHQPRIVLHLHAVVPLGVLPHDRILVETLLQPDVAAAVACTEHAAAGKARRRAAAGDDHRNSAVERGVHGAAVVLRAAVDMRRSHRGLAGHRGVAERRVERGVLVRDGDELRRLAALRVRLRHGLLVEADLRARGEEDVVDAGRGHRRDHGVAVVVGREFGPGARFVAQNTDVLVHGPLP